MTYPAIMPALTLDFQNSQQLDPRVTFSRSSGATYINSAGQVAYAADHEARFDHDGNGECLGLLIEESRTNHVIDNDQVMANRDNCTPTQTTGPDGVSTSASRLTAIASGFTNASNATNRTITWSADVITTWSFYFNPANTTATTVGSGAAAGAGVGGATFEWSTLTATPDPSKPDVIDAGIIYVGNGWYRAWTIYGDTISSSTNYRFNVSFTAVAAGESIDVFGQMVEEGTFPTSYIATSGSTVTRSQDLAQVTTADIYGDEFTIINKPFGVSSGSDTLHLQGHPHVERAVVYNEDLSQEQINAVTNQEDDKFWQWKVLGSSFALSSFTTDGQVTVDWGDGTVEVLTQSSHTFTNGSGYHDVGFRLDSGTYFQPRMSNNSTHDQKLISTGPVPTSMKVNCNRAFYGCTNLESIDPSLNLTGDNPNGIVNNCTNLKNFPLSDFSTATSMGAHLGGGNRGGWKGCSSITSFPAIDFPLITDLWNGWNNCTSMRTFNATWGSGVTNMQQAFYNCSSLESMPFRQTQNVTSFSLTWQDCASLTSFPLIDTSSGTNFNSTWRDCTSLTSFPLIDTSSGTIFYNTFYGCTGLTSFPQLDMSNGETFYVHGGGGTGGCWYNCNSLVSFPSISFDSVTFMKQAWRNCTSLQNFPANAFDNWTGTPLNECFNGTWLNCSSLTPASVVNILDSLAVSGVSAPSGTGSNDKRITIDWDGTGTPATTSAAAITTLKSRNWEIYLNNVLQ